jgi:hypothetical protein
MDRLNLEFLPQQQSDAWPNWVLLAAGVLFCVEIVGSYYTTSKRLIEMGAESGDTRVVRFIDRTAQTLVTSPEEMEKARKVIRDVSLPWGDMFAALESVPNDGVGVLEFIPDAEKKTLTLRGEAASLPAILTFMAELERTELFHDVTLEKHDIKQDAANQVVAFVLAAQWGTP